MTDDIAALKERVVEAARAVEGLVYQGAYRDLKDAVAALKAAEERARKPRLRTHAEFASASCSHEDETRVRIFAGVCAASRDAEWIVAIRALCNSNPAGDFARLHDIEALLPGEGV